MIDKLPTLKDYLTDEEWERMGSQCAEWISVRDRLPTDKNHYLIYAPSWKIPIKVLRYHPGLKRFWYGGDYAESVTHWMPLPEAPK